MGTTQNVGEGLTFEKVWAGIQELRELQKETALQMKELQRETALQMKESQRETDRQMKESQRETDRQMKETDRRVGEMTNRFGEMVEYMIVPNL
ncbi:MAG: hypothetical protein LBT16_13630, partial [Treponema sp.]|nr:hypothetical protein [Treponema sp.]